MLTLIPPLPPVSSPISCCIQVSLWVSLRWMEDATSWREGVKLHSVTRANKHVRAEKHTDWCQQMTERGRGGDRKSRKINAQQSGMRQTAWERAPDAVWEGYLIDGITPLFPFFLSFLFSLFPSSITHTHINTHAHHICPVTSLSLHDTPPMLLPAPFCPRGLSLLWTHKNKLESVSPISATK